jgi:hypothetical protein
MKYIKKFENNNNLEVGDYVLVDNIDYISNKDVVKLLLNNIGTIIKIDSYYSDVFWVKYENNAQSFPIDRKEIAHHSKNKNDLQYILDAKKYNL